MKRLVAIAAGMLFALTGAVDAMAKGEGIEAALIRCVDVTYPAPLSLCGTDPLTTGKLEVKQTGEVEASVTGALPNATYDVLLGSIDGSSPISIAVMSTDGSGNGKVQASGAFDLDDEVALGTLTTNNKGKGQLRLENLVPETTAGTGNVVLRRDAHDQFVTGFQVIRKRPPFVAKVHAGLLRCASVNTLAALTGCGADQLKKGEVLIDEKGDVKVHLFGAVPGTVYEVFFVAFDASSEVSLGTLTTNPPATATRSSRTRSRSAPVAPATS
jgi:hypothetical protein